MVSRFSWFCKLVLIPRDNLSLLFCQSSCSTSLGNQIAQRKVINNVLDLFDLFIVSTLSQHLISEKDLRCTSFHLPSSATRHSSNSATGIPQTNPWWNCQSASDAYSHQESRSWQPDETALISHIILIKESKVTNQFLSHGNQRKQILFDGQVESILLFQVHGDCT